MAIEEREEERRYEEAGRSKRRELDRRLLEDPITVLQPRPAVVVEPTQAVADVAARMADEGQGCVVVVENERLAGIFTESDLLKRVVAAGKNPADVTVGDVMTGRPEFAMNEDTLGYALHKMAVGRLRHLPVVDDEGRPIGMLTQREGVRYLAGFFPETLINQPPRSFTQNPPDSREGG
jgi:CBS domain-containing protein